MKWEPYFLLTKLNHLTRHIINQSALNRFHQEKSSIAPKIYLQTCYLCGLDSSDLICQTCQIDLRKMDSSTHMLNALAQPKVARAIGPCMFERLYVPFYYQWPIATLIKDLKFARKDYLAHQLAKLMLPHLKLVYQQSPLPEAIIPVPIHTHRFRQRKYNQATLIAQPLAQAFDIPVLTEICHRIHDTQAQTHLGGTSRRQNLKHAFAATSLKDINHIAIVDDVITTGATLNNLTKALKSINPNLRVDAWTIAISLT